MGLNEKNNKDKDKIVKQLIYNSLRRKHKRETTGRRRELDECAQKINPNRHVTRTKKVRFRWNKDWNVNDLYEKFREESLLRKEANLIIQENEVAQGKINETYDEEKIEQVKKNKRCVT